MKVETLKREARRKERDEAWSDALEAYRKATELLEARDDPDIALYNRMGDLELRLEREDAALEHFERAIDLYVESALFHNAVGVSKKLIRNLPDRDEPHLRLGRLRIEQGLRADARAAYVTYAERRQARGEEDEALEALMELADRIPEEVEIREMVAGRLAEHGRTQEAVDQYAALRRTLLETGDTDRAEAVADTIRELDPDADLTVDHDDPGGEADADPLSWGTLYDPTTDEAPAPPSASSDPDEDRDDVFESGALLTDEDLDDDVGSGEPEEGEKGDASDDEGVLEPGPALLSSASDDDLGDAGQTPDPPEEVGGMGVVTPTDAPDKTDRAEEDLDEPLEFPMEVGMDRPWASGDEPQEPEEIQGEVESGLGEGMVEGWGEEPLEATDEGPGVQESEPFSPDGTGPEPEPDPEELEVPGGDAGAGDYVDLGALILGDEEEKDTRMKVPTQQPTGDEDADFARMLKQFKEKVAENLEVDDARERYDLGTAYRGMGLLDEAIEQLQQALRANPKELRTYEVLGQCFLEKGEPRATIQLLERALHLPDQVEDDRLRIYYDLARAHEEVGNVEEAREFYEKVFSLDINFEDITDRLRRVRTGETPQ